MIDFLERLYAHCEGGWISLLTIDRSTGEKNVGWVPLGDWQSIELPDGACAWFGAATRGERLPGGRRGGAAECAQVPALWVDIDVQSPVHAADDLPADIDQARELLDTYPLAPTVVVDSGNGLQAWWMLDEPLDAADAADVLADWGTTWNVLGHRKGWHVDNVFDVARVMRLPGTHNHKTVPARPVTIIEADWNRTYGVDEIAEHTLDAPPAPAAQPTRNGVPYIGPERPGDAYNATHTGAELLEAHGFHFDHELNGDRHYRAPHRPAKTETTGATAYADGHTTIWSETACRTYGLTPRRPYDPFGLYVHLEHGGDWAAATRRLREDGYGSDDWGVVTTGEVDETWPDPIPLGAQARELPLFPTHALPDWMADQSHNVADELQMPVDLPAILGLVALATVAAGRVDVNVAGPWNEPLNIYCAVAMPPSAGKSPAFAQMLKPVKDHEARLLADTADTLPHLAQNRRMLEKQMQKAENAGDGEEARRYLNELLELGNPVIPRLIADDATPEALTQLLADHGGRMAILSTEGGLFDLMTGRYSEKANLDVYLKAWGGDTIIVDRIGRGPSKIDNPALTIGLTVQPHVLAALADKPELAGRGLTARIMYALPPDNVGQRDYLTDRTFDHAVADRYASEMAAVIASLGAGATRLVLHADAHRAFKHWKQQLENDRKPDGPLRPLAEWSTKLESTTVRVACLLHLADRRPLHQPIDLATMHRAIEIGDYWLAHAFAVHDLWGADPVLHKARKILDWIGDQQSFTVRDCYGAPPLRRLFGRAENAIDPLGLLIERGWIRPVDSEWPPRIGARGKESPTLAVHPSISAHARHVNHVYATSDRNGVKTASHARHVNHVLRDKTEESLTHSENPRKDTDLRTHGAHGSHEAQLPPTGTDDDYF